MLDKSNQSRRFCPSQFPKCPNIAEPAKKQEMDTATLGSVCMTAVLSRAARARRTVLPVCLDTKTL